MCCGFNLGFYIGGQFTYVASTILSPYLARYDGDLQTWTAVAGNGTSLSGIVHALQGYYGADGQPRMAVAGQFKAIAR